MFCRTSGMYSSGMYFVEQVERVQLSDSVKHGTAEAGKTAE